jgi:hypothetical protein
MGQDRRRRAFGGLNASPSGFGRPRPYNVPVKTTLILVLLGALLGIVAASYIVPPALSWYTEPGGLPHGTQIQALVQIPEVIRYATGRLIRGQLIGATIGAAGGLILGIVFAAKRRTPIKPV